MSTEDFTYATMITLAARGSGARDKATISIAGPGTSEIVRVLERTLVETVDGAVATGREIIDFLTTFNGGQSSVENNEQIQDSMGGWLLKLDTFYSLRSFGMISWEDQTQEFEEALKTWRRAQGHADPRKNSPRYPYTYAQDLLVHMGPREVGAGLRPVINRAAASVMLQSLAVALNVAHHELAEMLANWYLANEGTILEAAAARVGELSR